MDTINNNASCGVILLAAGSSSRLGHAKQLLPYGDRTLLQHSLDEALQAAFSSIVVVLGANADVIAAHLQGQPVHSVINHNWNSGMASSVRTGLVELLRIEPQTTSAIFMVCDQPFVSASLLTAIHAIAQKNGNGIIACSYSDTIGTPVLFNKKYFSELLALDGQAGARRVVMKHMDDVASVAFPMGHIDIDTIADYNALSGQKR
jgi:molybdenum cofactor cytidylyltransferase